MALESWRAADLDNPPHQLRSGFLALPTPRFEMTYQVLARKWRPQDFSSIVGQKPIITALRNGLKDFRIAQAYLFSGIRGVGKTTAARVLSKALNCERGPRPDRPAADPCNECSPCTEITAGTNLDVLEVDAATYSKVEQVRELTESLRYGPARDRYKVVILDEVHRLSRQAFDALLKIVEEPPSHLVFVFATTEVDTVPATILSRCQEFQFRRVPSPLLAQHLRRISDAEEIDVSDVSLRLIARAGEGSVRDSVALLDQLATFGNSIISDQDASNLLGGLDIAVFHRLLKAILEGQALAISKIVHDIEASGWDPHNVYGQFLAYSRDALQLAMGGQPENIDLPLEEAESLVKLVRPFKYENLLRLTHHLLTSETTVRRSEFAILALQLAWLRAAELPKLTRIEDLLSGQQPPGSQSSPGPELNSTAQEIENRTTPNETASASAASGTLRSDSSSAESDIRLALAPIDETPTSPVDGIAAFRQLLSDRHQGLAALFESATISFENQQMKIQPRADDSLLTNALKRDKNVTLIEELLLQAWGEGMSWILQTPAPSQLVRESRGKSESKAETQEAHEDPTVRAVLDIFGGNIQSVQ